MKEHHVRFEPLSTGQLDWKNNPVAATILTRACMNNVLCEQTGRRWLCWIRRCGVSSFFAVLWWKFVPRVRCPHPRFPPHSCTANLFGFNQSASWLTILFALPFSYVPSVSYLSVFSSLLSLPTQHFNSLPPTLSSYLSTCPVFPCLRFSICMLMFCCTIWRTLAHAPYSLHVGWSHGFQSLSVRNGQQA